jgi:mRNA interferase RelE/StbE
VKILYTKSFDRDIGVVKNNPDIKKRLLEVIGRLRDVESLDEVHGIRKIEGYETYYRLRIGDYRLGIKVAGATLELIRFLHRKDIYRRFP